MSERFSSDERQSHHPDGDRELAQRARQQMRAAVSTLRAEFGADLLSTEIAQPDHDEADAAGARFVKRRSDG
jgi:hypothetical protein